MWKLVNFMKESLKITSFCLEDAYIIHSFILARQNQTLEPTIITMEAGVELSKNMRFLSIRENKKLVKKEKIKKKSQVLRLVS